MDYSIRSTVTSQGPTKQELTSFDAERYELSYKSLSGTPFFIKSVNASWILKKVDDNVTKLNMNVRVETKGIMGVVLTPVVKIKLGKLGLELVEELKYFIENGKPHLRKEAATSVN